MPDPAAPPDPVQAPSPCRAFDGQIFRALNPIWARDPLSGEGAQRHGGRYNPKGCAALYTSLSPVTALTEANQAGRPFEPVTLVAYQARLTAVLDCSDPGHRAAHAITPALLADNDWRLTMREGAEPPGQALARRLIAAGYEGMLAPSMAPGAGPGAMNLILWRWDGGRVQLLDSEDRLGRQKI